MSYNMKSGPASNRQERAWNFLNDLSDTSFYRLIKNPGDFSIVIQSYLEDAGIEFVNTEIWRRKNQENIERQNQENIERQRNLSAHVVNNSWIETHKALQEKYELLKKQFETLFGTLPAETRTEVSSLPDDIGAWRVRVHIPAFTIETTTAALTAARTAPQEAISWEAYHTQFANKAESLRSFIEASKRLAGEQIILQVLDSRNKLESLEVIPETPNPLEPPKE